MSQPLKQNGCHKGVLQDPEFQEQKVLGLFQKPIVWLSPLFFIFLPFTCDIHACFPELTVWFWGQVPDWLQAACRDKYSNPGFWNSNQFARKQKQAHGSEHKWVLGPINCYFLPIKLVSSMRINMLAQFYLLNVRQRTAKKIKHILNPRLIPILFLLVNFNKCGFLNFVFSNLLC